jgi:hypothetical protein
MKTCRFALDPNLPASPEAFPFSGTIASRAKDKIEKKRLPQKGNRFCI